MALQTRGRARRSTDTAPVWVVTVDYRGQRLRWCSAEVTWDCQDEDGQRVAFVGSWTAPTAIDLAGDVETSVEVIFPSGLAVAEAELEGSAPLSGCAAEVAWLPHGGDWSDRYVAAEGLVDGPEIGGDGEPVMFGIVPATRTEDATLIPEPAHAVTVDRWTTSPEASQGLYYPHVYGRPGWYRVDGETFSADGSPAVVVWTSTTVVGDETTVKADTLIIAADVPPSTTQVRLRWASSPGVWRAHTKTIVPLVDPFDRTVATLDISLFSDDDRQAGAYFVSWQFGAASDSESAEQIVRTWLEASSVRVDLLRSQAGLRALAGFRIGGFVNQPTTPMAWIADRLDVFPVRLVDGPSGVYLAAVRWEASAEDAVAAITVTKPMAVTGGKDGAVRITPLRATGGQATEVRLSWALDCASGAYKMLTVLAPGGDARTVRKDDTARVAAAGVKVVQYDLPDVWDDDTATLLARFLAWREGRLSRTVRVSVPTDGYAHLVEGDAVTYTEDALGVSGRVALVNAIGLTTAPMMELELQFP